MQFGIGVSTHINNWDIIRYAEELGYDRAWVGDSQMIWSDCYATMALAAAGRLSPLLCAVLMPASSLAAIATVLHGARRARSTLAAAGQPSAEAQACRPTPEARAA